MKKKFLIVLGVLVFDFLLLSGSIGFAYINIVGPGDIGLSSIQQPGGSGSFAGSFLIIEANQDVQITFNTTGNFKREERDKSGAGLGRYDVLETTIVNLKIHGSNAFVWDGSMDNLDGLTTSVITPDGNEEVWMDLNMNAVSDPINWGDSQWYESDDAGIYWSNVTMTVVAVGPPLP